MNIAFLYVLLLNFPLLDCIRFQSILYYNARVYEGGCYFPPTGCGVINCLYLYHQIYKIYADVGKKDWPHDFHSFFDSVTGLLGDGKSPETGLRMLRVTLEELVSRQGVPAKRGDELVRMVTAQVWQAGACPTCMQASHPNAA